MASADCFVGGVPVGVDTLERLVEWEQIGLTLANGRTAARERAGGGFLRYRTRMVLEVRDCEMVALQAILLAAGDAPLSIGGPLAVWGPEVGPGERSALLVDHGQPERIGLDYWRIGVEAVLATEPGRGAYDPTVLDALPFSWEYTTGQASDRVARLPVGGGGTVARLERPVERASLSFLLDEEELAAIRKWYFWGVRQANSFTFSPVVEVFGTPGPYTCRVVGWRESYGKAYTTLRVDLERE